MSVKQKYEKKKFAKGHTWQRNYYNSNVDIFAFSEGHHNGPKCTKCGYEFCHHCSELPEQNCLDTE